MHIENDITLKLTLTELRLLVTALDIAVSSGTFGPSTYHALDVTAREFMSKAGVHSFSYNEIQALSNSKRHAEENQNTS